MAGSKRTFLRGMSSEQYGLAEHRRRILETPRVRRKADQLDATAAGQTSDAGAKTASHAHWALDPSVDPFLTQSIQVHFLELPPRSSNSGHGHQNEAAFYILEGSGYDVHDGKRYEWQAGDLVVVHVDSVHRHFNPNDVPVRAVVLKAKATWMYLGLVQQGKSGPFALDDYGERVDWSTLWTEGATERAKVVPAAGTPIELTPLGSVRVLSGPERPDVRTFSVDVATLDIPSGSRSGRRWQMADEALYVVSGSGYTLHWQVEAELDDKYYARIARTPSRYDFAAGDTIYIPPNTVAQHFSSADAPVRLLSARNRVFRTVGYDRIAYLENAPEYDAAHDTAAIPLAIG
jgi:quercetin dioxygenase-like cupin family protein